MRYIAMWRFSVFGSSFCKGADQTRAKTAVVSGFSVSMSLESLSGVAYPCRA
jgi:hypothetical protein